MKLIRYTLSLLIFLYILTGCTSNTKEYSITFTGTSLNWSAELVQKGNMQYRNHKELKDQYEIKYGREQVLSLKYIGNESDLGQVVEYSFRGSRNSREASEGEVIQPEEVFTSISSSEGVVSHVPKDSGFEPVNSKSTEFEVTVKWNGQEEKVRLRYEEK